MRILRGWKGFRHRCLLGSVVLVSLLVSFMEHDLPLEITRLTSLRQQEQDGLEDCDNVIERLGNGGTRII